MIVFPSSTFHGEVPFFLIQIMQIKTWSFCVLLQAQHFCQMYQPGISLTELEASVGRVTLVRKQTEAVQLSV